MSVLARFALLIPLAGCYSWRAESVQPLQALGDGRYVRLTLPDGSRPTVHDAKLVNDSVIGLRRSGYEHRAGTIEARFAMLARDIGRVELRRLSPGKTTGAILGISAIALVIGAGISLGSCCY